MELAIRGWVLDVHAAAFKKELACFWWARVVWGEMLRCREGFARVENEPLKSARTASDDTGLCA